MNLWNADLDRLRAEVLRGPDDLGRTLAVGPLTAAARRLMELRDAGRDLGDLGLAALDRACHTSPAAGRDASRPVTAGIVGRWSSAGFKAFLPMCSHRSTS